MAFKTMKRQLKRQEGFSFWGWLIIIALIAFFATIILRLYPAYYEYFTVASIMNRLEHEDFSAGTSKSDIVTRLTRTMTIDNVNRVKLDDFDIKPTKGGFTVTLDYEDRVQMMGNVDAVAKFNKKIEIVLR